VDPGDAYLSDQLIAYIGNKRALLPFLRGVFSALAIDPAGSTFLDPFAGSGSVSRLARDMGFTVRANDWEPYAHVINSAHLRLRPADLDALFPSGVHAVLHELNTLPSPAEALRYISRHYAPRATAGADWRTERLFYTTENALAIDAIRQRIEEMLPGTPAAEADFLRKAALLAPLLYQAATHTNTSGVFKACHKGFGGHGRDALQRIMAPIVLRPPVLSDSPAPAEVACMDAAAFLATRTAELCYLDPPYAVHQYGSNYFMLNTIALWDRPPVNEERGPDGRLLHKGGIRPDWTRTRSAFCYKDTAAAAMRAVVHAADCRWLAVSYSNEGLIGLEELCDLLAETGALTVRSRGYAKYPGGKQSMHRATRNMELVLVVHRGAAARGPARVGDALMGVRLQRLLALSYDPARLRRSFPVRGDAIVAADGTRMPMRHLWRFTPDAALPRFADGEAARSFLEKLSPCAVEDLGEEIRILVSIAEGQADAREKAKILRESLRLLNKLAHRKYRVEFAAALALLRTAAPRLDADGSFTRGLDAVSTRAATRLAASPGGRVPGQVSPA
jgi:adenine-specific DNA-methyltransferase